MITVLVVDDSSVMREFLAHVLASDPDITVVGTASDGEEAVEAVARVKPAVVTMDVHMPKLNGLDATRRIMETHPVPIVIVSGTSTVNELVATFRALDAGALAVVRRPAGVGHPDYAVTAAELVQTVKLMAEVKVVRRWPRAGRERKVLSAAVPRKLREVRLVAIGASTGGPQALQTVLSGLPRDFPAPVLIVQHIAPGFVGGLAEWLAESSGFPVQVATHGESPRPGHAYLAPDGCHMRINAAGRIVLSSEDPVGGLRPSVSVLFRSVAEVVGSQTAGVLLTGMGKDGADELKLMKDQGALTIVQDEDSSVVPGMPGEAIRLGAATYMLTPEMIADLLVRLTGAAGRRR